MTLKSGLIINDWDANNVGLVVETVEGWMDAPSVRDRTTQLPQRAGTVLLAPEAETTPRNITVSGVIRRTSMTAVRTAIHELQERLYRGTIEVSFEDDPDKVIFARCESGAVVATPPQFASPHSRVTIRLLCPDPLIYDKLGSVVGFPTAVRTAVPLGTAPSAPVVRVMGAANGPTLTYRNHAGESVETMVLATNLLSTDYLEIDCELFTIRKFTSGVETNAIGDLTSGDFFLLDPQDGDYPNSAWPTVETSLGTGEVLYRRTWL